MKASDISDVDFLQAVFAAGEGHPAHWAYTWDLAESFPMFPYKVVHAKARKLLKRRLLTGCGCGCRGDWELTESGIELLAQTTGTRLVAGEKPHCQMRIVVR